jgi:hypothetical protein
MRSILDHMGFKLAPVGRPARRVVLAARARTVRGYVAHRQSMVGVIQNSFFRIPGAIHSTPASPTGALSLILPLASGSGIAGDYLRLKFRRGSAVAKMVIARKPVGPPWTLLPAQESGNVA